MPNQGETSGVATQIPACPPTFAFEPFDRSKTKWSRWVKRLEGACEIFGIPDNKKKNMLLHYMGAETYNVLCDNLSPAEPENKTYADIVKTLEEYFDPAPLEMVELWKFRQRMQREGLRNQLVFGLRSDRTRTRLIEEKKLTFDKAKQIALSMEASGEGAEALNRQMHDVNLTDRKRSQSRRGSMASANNKVTNPTKRNVCFRCGSEAHYANKCEHINKICGLCHKKGHLKRVCLSASAERKQFSGDGYATKSRPKKHFMNLVEDTIDSESEYSNDDAIQIVEICKLENDYDDLSKIFLSVRVGGSLMKFEVDSGSPVSLISNADRIKYLKDLPLKQTDIQLRSYCGNKIGVFGVIETEVVVKGQSNQMRLFVVDAKRHPLLGREWMRALRIDWNNIMGDSVGDVNKITLRTSMPSAVKGLLEEFASVFDESIGKMGKIKASLHLKPDSKPIFLKARTLPFSIRDIVEQEINSLVESGVLVKVNRSEWATPVVPVMKSSNKVRLCGDYKLTVNKCLIVDEHPLPTVNEMFSNMAGGEKFTKLDLAQAYLQMEVRPEDQSMLTLNTHLGLYQPTRLMYGVASAPAIFQREISQILQGIPGVTVFLDDVEITGPDDETHLARLREVLRRFHENNIRVNVQKCEFFAESIEYCGYIIDRRGISKMPQKVEAIQEMPRPKNREQVRAFMGLINYYGRFIKNLSTKLYPINSLLKENMPFVWTKACEQAFLWVKAEMQSDRVLVHYDSSLPLVLATDASPYGVGAVLSHIFPDGVERPIQYASQTLSVTQQNYTQVDKEAYAIIFGVKKFYQYLFGRKFILVTDNKPVVQILSPDKGLPTMSALRMQHYAVFLETFDFDIRYRASKDHGNADGMSRLPVRNSSSREQIEEVDVIQVNQIETLPITVEELEEYTAKDKNVKQLIQGLRSGRPVEGSFRFGVDQNQFTMQGSCLMRGIRVYIPPPLRDRVLAELHSGHFGVSRMKSLARSYCWWENIDKAIEDLAKDCVNCARFRTDPPKVAVHCWERPSEPFQRIHADFAGPFLGLFFLILVDAHSKWPEIKVVPDITAETTIRTMREFFANFGLPSVLVTDRGTQFTSDQFQKFLRNNGITHKMGAPYHPATNGQAERYVQTFKNKLKSLNCSRTEVHAELQKILMAYRRTVHPATGQSPSMLVFGRQIKSRVDLMIPNVCNRNYSRGEDTMVRSFSVNERVAARDFLSNAEKWKFGVVAARIGKLHYMIELDDGRMWKRHIDQLRAGPLSRQEALESASVLERSVIVPSTAVRPTVQPKIELDETDSTIDDSNDLDIPSNQNDRTRTPVSIAVETGGSGLNPDNKRSAKTRASETGNATIRRSYREKRPPRRLDL
ncbi:uncharacterized protein K02A2.6-like [Armigeres subalbatus]|uniref:uncharacterized protein K02A2.6-like n=1 Tax=Armigeres subalbatus TaxID=124917 RepID=UPI002ED5B3CE